MSSIRLAALAAAIAVAAPASAAQRATASTRTRTSDAPPRLSAPPSNDATSPQAAATPTAVAPVAAPARTTAPARTAVPAPAAAQAATSAAESASAWRFGAGVGFEFGMGDLDYSAPQVRIEAERALGHVSPVTTVSFVGSLSMSHPSGSESVQVVIPTYPPSFQSATLEWDANVFEVIPAARFTYASSRSLSFFADGGLGLVYTASRVRAPSGFAGGEDVVSDGIGAVLRIGGGLVITPTPALRIGIQAVGLHLRFGDGPGTGFGLAASFSHVL